MGVYCHGNAAVLRRLFLHALSHHAQGCTNLLLSYDMALRADLPPPARADERDTRLPAVLATLQTELKQHIDFSVDGIGANQVLLEKQIHHEAAS